MRLEGRLIAAGLIAAILIALGFSSYYTVDQGERAVVTRLGAVAYVAEPGLGFKVPIMDHVHYLSTQTQSKTWEKLQTYSKDQQPADMKISVQYRLIPARVAEVYAEFGTLDNLSVRMIEREVPQEVKTVFGQFTAVSAIQNRDGLNRAAFEAVAKAIAGPAEIIGVQIENIDFSDAYEESIEARMQAEVAVQKLRQDAEREKVQAEITVTKAKAEADSTRAKAIAEAEATRIRGEAQAAAIRARGDALRDSQAIIALTQAERWDGRLPSTMVPGGALPFMELK
jgi:regulator of protease activity HflC (stomatin/prohibitin superfamily)